MIETIYLAGGCLWGVQAYVKMLPGVIHTEAGRANGQTDDLDGPYDGYAECVKTLFDSDVTNAYELTARLFEAIDPYSINQQGEDIGLKYRTGVYSEDVKHLEAAQSYILDRRDSDRIVVEVLPLTHYVKSAEMHQDYLEKHPGEYCHIDPALMQRYQSKGSR